MVLCGACIGRPMARLIFTRRTFASIIIYRNEVRGG